MPTRTLSPNRQLRLRKHAAQLVERRRRRLMDDLYADWVVAGGDRASFNRIVPALYERIRAISNTTNVQSIPAWAVHQAIEEFASKRQS